MICTNNREKTYFTIVVKILYTNSYKRICFTILYCTLVQILCTSNCKMSCCYELNKFSVQTTRKGLFYSTVHTFGTNKRKTFFFRYLNVCTYYIYVQKTGKRCVVLYCSSSVYKEQEMYSKVNISRVLLYS